MQITKIFGDYPSLLDKEISVSGWVKTCRDQKQMIFIHLSDGTTQKTLQIVASPDNVTNITELAAITTGTSLSVSGILVKSPAKGQLFELSARQIIIYQICPGNYPLQKVGLPLDFMRSFPHLRHRSNIMRAMFLCKSVIVKSIHDFFTSGNYCYVDLPILTTNACEGGCQPLQVTSLLDSGKISDIPAITTDTNQIDFTKDFFDNPVYLTVSNQLHLECFAHGMGYVYTITPATRGEPSQSTKHLAHFSMLEVEFCFGELSDNISIAEKCIKYCATEILNKCKNELEVLNKASGGKLIEKIIKIISEPFIRIEHRDAITILRESHKTIPFIEEPQYAGDLSGEHERFLVKHFNHPVVVMRYPKKVKAFYMPIHHCIKEENASIQYVDCFDLLMDIGEVVGGSQRIWNEKELLSRMNELDIDSKHLDWYVDLRRYGSVPHGGFGLGIERLVAALTGMANVKDCISFPLTVHHCTH